MIYEKEMNLKKNDLIIRIALLLILSAIVYSLNKNFLKPTNLVNILRQASLLFILGIGMTLVILTRGIDLSNGAIVALSSCIGGIILKYDVPIYYGIVTSISIGFACGLFNGIVISHFKIPPFISTFSMMYIARGIAYIVLKGRPVFGFSESFRFIGTGHFIGIPMPIIISIFLLIIFYIITENTSLGINIRAVGADIESTRLAAINTKQVTTIAYVISGSLSAFVGLLYTARLNTASPTVGSSFPLDTIAVVIIGGASFEGGRGNLIGTAIGALIITIILNGMNLMNISSHWQDLISGGLILALIILKKITEIEKILPEKRFTILKV